MNSYQLIIFDCDGVLVDSEPIEQAVLTDMAAELGVSLNDPNTDRNQYRGGALRYVINHLEAKLGQAVPDDFVDTFRHRTYSRYDRELQPIPGIKQVLAELTLPYCVASSGPRSKIQRNLNTTGLYPLFEGKIFSSYDIKSWKPDPDIFLYAARLMDVAPQNCVVVEDSALGAQAGIAAGMRVLGYANAETAASLHEAGATVFYEMGVLLGLLNGRGNGEQ